MTDLRSDWQKRQAALCSCKGTDDYCPCQNVDFTTPQPTQPSIPIGQREDLVQQIKRIVGCIAHDADRGTVEVFKLIDSLAALSATPVDVGEGKPPA